MADRRQIVALCALLFVVSITAVAPVSTSSVGVVGEHRSPAVDTPGSDHVPSATTTDDLQCPIPSRENETAAPTEPRIVELYPNPTTHENAGEYLVLETPPDTALANWTITDGHTTATFPNETVSGRVAASTDPDATAPLTDEPIVALEGTLRLAVDGDELTLRNETTVVDDVAYDRAPVAQRWYRTDGEDGDAGAWWPRGATCRPVSTFDAGAATTFVLPDSPAAALEPIRGADDRVLLAGYTFTDRETTDALVDAADRGVEVAVLLEAGPVGGTPTRTSERIERLLAAGVDVRALGGEGARYRFHHPKYLVADETAVVTSENWKPSGVGGASSRGWGVQIDDAALAAALESVFRADFEGWDTEPGAAYLETTDFVADDPAPSREFDAAHEPTTVPVDSAELLLAPDNAESRLQTLIAAADDELLVKQASVAPDVSVLEASIEAARRGVDVQLLLDASWYVEDDHERLAAELEAVADSEELALDVRLVDDTDAFEKIHAKGIVIDRETAIVGSANWNDNSLRQNREVLVALHGDAVGDYYAAVFEDDWEGETWSLPIGLSATVVATLVGAAVVGRRYIRFGDEDAARRSAE